MDWTPENWVMIHIKRKLLCTPHLWLSIQCFVISSGLSFMSTQMIIVGNSGGCPAFDEVVI